MVAIDPEDPESVEQASSMISLSKVSAVVYDIIYRSWIRSKNSERVGARFRAFLDNAIRDFGENAEQYFEGLGNSSGADVDLEEAQIRQAVYLYWIGLPQNRRDHETLECELRRILNEALVQVKKSEVKGRRQDQ
ncbi:hypothetical protein CGZ80_06995 [Rhodopirellula sp. MGV]|nr:hypothetical protein CGZ80_06995 [Rhodopirellula sp. MGV]